MAQVTITTKVCSDWIPVNKRVSEYTLKTFFEVEEMAKNVECEDQYLSQLLRDLKFYLTKPYFGIWLKENRKELRESVYLMSALDPLSSDSDEVCNYKLLMGAKLIEIIES